MYTERKCSKIWRKTVSNQVFCLFIVTDFTGFFKWVDFNERFCRKWVIGIPESKAVQNSNSLSELLRLIIVFKIRTFTQNPLIYHASHWQYSLPDAHSIPKIAVIASLLCLKSRDFSCISTFLGTCRDTCHIPPPIQFQNSFLCATCDKNCYFKSRNNWYLWEYRSCTENALFFLQIQTCVGQIRQLLTGS